MISIQLPQLAWDGTQNMDIGFPEDWNVEVFNMRGFDKTPLQASEIEAAILNPLDNNPLRTIAGNKNQVAVIFDDMSRITRVAEIVPHIIKELASAGITDNQIRFIAALGCHSAMDRYDFVKKLGEETLRRFPVYNHNPFDNCKYIGTTSTGIEVSINAEVMECDCKIAISSIVPHPFAGFGGGAKIIIPGLTSIETTEAFHRHGTTRIQNQNNEKIKPGSLSGNPLQATMDEVAKLVNLDYKVETIFNMWGQTVSVYAGDLLSVHSAAISEAKDHYLTERANDCDVIVANAFSKASEAEGGLLTVFPSVNTNGGDIVLICNAPQGHVVHYLLGRFGISAEGILPLQIDIPQHVNRIIILNSYPDLTIFDGFKQRNKITLTTTWDETLDLLKQNNGPNTKVAIYPNADVQYVS